MPDVHDADLPPSIALTVLVRPSRRLRGLLLLAALLDAGAAFALLSDAATSAWSPFLAAACCGAAALCAAAAGQRRNARQIDISKAGELHLTVQQNLPENGRAVRLLPGSLLWGRLLVLRLGSVDNTAFPVQTVVILPDSMEPDLFRALAVALRAIVARSGPADGKK